MAELAALAAIGAYVLAVGWQPSVVPPASPAGWPRSRAAIFLAVPRARRALEGYPLPAWLAEVVAVSAACGIATLPVLLFQFGTVPVYSVPPPRREGYVRLIHAARHV